MSFVAVSTLEKIQALFEQQSNSLERVHKICLKLILNEEYENYSIALQTFNLFPLKVRREKRVLSFSKKALKQTKHKSMVPILKDFNSNPHNLRYIEKYDVNHARTKKIPDQFQPIHKKPNI